MSTIRTIQKLGNIQYTNTLILNEVELMRREVIEKLKDLNSTTASLDKSKEPPKDWRIVPSIREAERQPLVKSDVETMMKKLNII